MAKLPAPRRYGWLPAGLLLCAAGAALSGGCAGFHDGQTPAAWTSPPAASYTPPATTGAVAVGGPTVRGQGWDENDTTAGSDDHFRQPMAVADAAADTRYTTLQPPQPSAVLPHSAANAGPGYTVGAGVPAPPVAPTRASVTDNDQWLSSPYLNSTGSGYVPAAQQLPGIPVPLDVMVEETRTGRLMFGAGVNSDAGVTGQVTIDERNFSLFNIPTSWAELVSGQAFRGAGQAFRLEAMPGNRVQRYLVSFTEPYLFWTPISLNVSGFLYDRGFYDWNESRAGGRLGLGYRLTSDLSVSAALRMEEVRITDPRIRGVEQLERVLGNNDFFSSQYSLRHDTRDLPFAPTEGHLIELTYEQAFGEFDYPRGELDLRKYFMVRERPDGSGRHTIALSLITGVSGNDTPVFENFFAGGFSTLRGFDFRGASPVENTVIVGGRFQLLGSVEYSMPLTADDMIKAVAFCDYGTVEQEITINEDNFRVAPGFGFRISVPALGPAPLAFDFAFPVAKADTDDEQIFSFFFGVGRG